MARIFELPYFYYTAIAIFFLMYVVLIWRKESFKRNMRMIVFFLVLFLSFFSMSSNMEMRYVLNSLDADTIVIESAEDAEEVNAKEILEGVSGIFCDKENIVRTIGSLNEEEELVLKFYKDSKLLIQMKVVEVDQETGYSGNINGKSVELKWQRYRLKYSKVFYQNLERVLVE